MPPEIVTTVGVKPQIDPQQKAAILMAVAQLDMLVQAFATAPERVLKSAKEFKVSLEEWASA